MIPKIYAEERAKLLDDINGLRVEKDEKKKGWNSDFRPCTHEYNPF